MDITSRVIDTGTAVADQGFRDGKAGKAPAGDVYFATMAVKTLPGVKDLDILIELAEGLLESYMIGYEGGLKHGKAT